MLSTEVFYSRVHKLVSPLILLAINLEIEQTRDSSCRTRGERFGVGEREWATVRAGRRGERPRRQDPHRGRFRRAETE